jgi:hypothetical protein
LPREKNLAKNKYNFAKRENFSQKKKKVLLRVKNLTKNRYKFCQERKLTQEEI